MRGLFVAVVGAVVIVASALGLSLGAFRSGPLDEPLQPVIVTAGLSGTYHSRADSSVLGVCPLPPCEAETVIDVRFHGLPAAPYEARLDGVTQESVGPLRLEGSDLVLRWSQPREHADKDRFVLALAGRDVAAVPVRSSQEPLDLGGPLEAGWGAAPASVHLNEIGGITIASIAAVRLAEAAPAGWEFRAWFEGTTGVVELGALDSVGDASILEARVERLRLEDQERFVIALAPQGSEPGGFPVLAAALG